MGNRKISRLTKPASLILLAFTAVGAPGQEKVGSSADLTKRVRVELPTKTVVSAKSSGLPTNPANFRNPKVEPGLVHWHATFADACAASRRSGKPVLLFQMMGRLDEQFC